MPTITAKPITATPITARPLTAYRLGERVGGRFNPASLFSGGELGALFLSAIENVSTDTGGTTGADSSGDAAKHLLDLSGNDAHATGDGAQTYQIGWDYGEIGVEYIDNRSGNLSVTLGDLGSSATRVVVKWGEIEILGSQTISGATSLPQEEFVLCMYIDRALTASEIAKIQAAYADQLRIPTGATLIADFTEGRFYWGGEVKAIGDLTNLSGDAYYLSHSAGITAGEASVIIDYKYDDPEATGGTLFSWTSGYPSGNRYEWYTFPASDSSRIYIAPKLGGGGDYNGMGVFSKDGEGGIAFATGIRRFINVLKSDTIFKYQPDNGEYRTDSATYSSGTIAAVTKLGFACRAWNATADGPLTGGELRKVVIFNSNLSESQVTAIGKVGHNYPIHLIGDSFLNNYKVADQLRLLTDAKGYIGLSQDGVGGTSLTQQAVRLSSNDPKWHDSTLVIVDGGFDGTYEDAVTAIESMRSTLSHDRWLFMEPAPNVVDGGPARDTWDAVMVALKSAYPDNFIDTLTLAMAESDGSPEDEADVVDRLWPRSLKISVSDFHPNAAGQAFLAGVIHDALVAKGWA